MKRKVASCVILAVFMIMCRSKHSSPTVPTDIGVSGCAKNDTCSAQLFSGCRMALTTGSHGQSLLQFNANPDYRVIRFRRGHNRKLVTDGRSWEELVIEYPVDRPQSINRLLYGRFGFAEARYQDIPPDSVTWEARGTLLHLVMKPPGHRPAFDLFFTLSAASDRP